MITQNPFTELTAYIPVYAMQLYVVAMALLVIGGTLLDVIHKKSARYFFENAEKAKKYLALFLWMTSNRTPPTTSSAMRTTYACIA